MLDLSEYDEVSITSVEHLPADHVWDVTLLDDNVPLPKSIITNGIVSHNSSAPDYYEGIFEFSSHMKEISELYGLKDESTGKWITRPKVRYYTPTTAEDFFNSAASTLRRIPNKEWLDNRWWYSWEPTVEGRAAAKGRHSKAMFTKYGRIMVESETGKPQAIYFLDSYPAMYPDALDEDDKGRGMAAVARAMSENIPKIFSKLRPKGVTIIGVNQLRLKPAVMYGCLHYDNTIHFVDGRTIPIGRVVEERIEGDVWCWNETEKRFEAKPIVGWHNNGVVQENGWVVVKTQGVGTKNGVTSVTVTPNHEILTDTGWREAQELTTDDMVMTQYVSTFNGTRAAFLAGVLSGDSCVVGDSRSVNSSLRLQCSHDPEYVQWKTEVLGGAWKESTDRRGFKNYTSAPCIEWSILKQKIEKRDPTKLSQYITPLSLAIMYMDDGNYQPGNKSANISYKRFKNNRNKQQEILAIWGKFGLEARFAYKLGTLYFNVENTQKLFKLIHKFVHPIMERKLSENWRARFRPLKIKSIPTTSECYAQVISVEPAGKRVYSAKRTKKRMCLYDITVAKNHNYLAGSLANGIIVHNTPEYEPGGESLKFSSSARVRQSALSVPSGWGKDKDNTGLGSEASVMYEGKDSYRYIKMKTIKNKTSTPYLTTMQRVWTDDGTGTAHGFDPAYDTFNYLKATGQIVGTMKALKSPLIDSKKPLDWLAFKALIVLKGKALKEHCQTLGLNKNPNIRTRCFQQIASGKGHEMYFNRMRDRAAKSADGEGDDDE